MGPLKVISRRLPEHPHGLVLRSVRRRHRQRRAQPVVRGAPRPARPRGRAPPRGRDPRDRRRCGPRGARRVRRHGGVGLDRARPADPARRRTPARRPRHPGQRPAGPPARRPRRHRAGLAGPVGPLLRPALDARRRGDPRDGVRRAGLPARPVAGDGRRRAPHRRRPGAVARRAGAHPPRGAGRLGGRAGDRRPGRRAATWSCSTATRCCPARTPPSRRPCCATCTCTPPGSPAG